MNKKLVTKPVLKLFDAFPRGSQRYRGADALVLAKFYVRGTDWAYYVLEAEPYRTEDALAKYVYKWDNPETYLLHGIAVNLNEIGAEGAYEDAPLAEFVYKSFHVRTEVTEDGREYYAERKFERDDDWTGKKHVRDIEGLNMIFDREQAEFEALADRYAEFTRQSRKAKKRQQQEPTENPDNGQN